MISAPVLVRAARFGVVEDLDPVFIEGEKIHEVLASARYDHLTGLLAAAVDHGVLVVDEPSRMLVRMAWQEELLACVVLESLAVRTAAVLDESEVRWRLTKGAALAHQDYPDPSLRTFGDVDVVVHPADWKRALDALARGGMQRFGADLGDEYDRRYGKGATLTSSDGYEVDLHRCFSVGRFGVTSQMEDAFAGAGSILLGGRVIPTLTPEFRLVHACHHAVLGGFQRLRAFRDVAQVLLLNAVDGL